MEYRTWAAGVNLLTQEYLAACAELRSRIDLIQTQHRSLKKDLADEHRLRCAQEWKAVKAQLRADNEMARKVAS
jgi:hypothetical protein